MESNFIDGMLLLLILLSAIHGWWRGFILGALDLVRWVGSLLLGLRFYSTIAHWLEPHVTAISDVWLPPLAFMFVTLTAGIIIHIFGYLLLKRLPREIHRHTINRMFGIMTGLACGVVTAVVVAPLLLILPLPEGLRGPTRNSLLTNYLSQFSNRLEDALNPIFAEPVRRTLNTLIAPPETEGEGSIKLPFTVSNPRPEPELEAQMLDLVNKERAAAGLSPLASDPSLTEVARRYSIDMFARGFFSHYTPEGLSPFDRMHTAGVSFRLAGENLALAPTLHIAHTGLMNSPGHRANILHPRFGRIGIGIMSGGVRGLMVTQEFRD
jgi:uncharacterized protein YkwD